MTATFSLFERWKAAKGYETDSAGAQALGVTRAATSLWRQGRNGSAAVIERMAKDLGEDPVPVILQAFAEAARDADDKRTLGRLARRLGAACVALLALAPWVMPSNAYAAPQGHAENHGLYIMRTRLRMALAAFARRWRFWTAPRLQPHDLEPVPCNHLASCLSTP